MRKKLVMTITGNDKVGIVEEVTGLVLSFKGNVDTSKMARLGGEFVMLMLVSVEERNFEAFQEEIRAYREKNYKVSIQETTQAVVHPFADWIPYEIHVKGADHEGLIHEITSDLADLGITVEEMDTDMEPAPFSGGHLFTMDAVVLAPPTLDYETIKDSLEDVANQLKITVEIVQHDL